jgi:hypothetical protein
LKPEIGLGYADFDMTPGLEYAVSVSDPTLQIVNRLRAETCLPGQDDTPLASWRLIVVTTNEAFTPTPTSVASPTALPTRTPRPRATTTPTSTPRPTRTRAVIP